jgi:hypothetical protein
MECHNCGFPIRNAGLSHCPKCDGKLRGEFIDELWVVDVAHDGETVEEAELKMSQAVSAALANRRKGVKIIHGKGRRGVRGGAIRHAAVRFLRTWVKRQGYGKLVPDRRNEGAHILYFNC